MRPSPECLCMANCSKITMTRCKTTLFAPGKHDASQSPSPLFRFHSSRLYHISLSLFPFPRFPRVFVILSYCAICFLVGCLKCFLRQGDRQAVTRTDTVDLAAEEIWLKKKKVKATSQKAKICYNGLFKRMRPEVRA